MTLSGHIADGLVVLDDPITLPDGTKVTVVTQEPAGAFVESLPAVPSLLERLAPVVGAAHGLPADAAANVDHYLYGAPRG